MLGSRRDNESQYQSNSSEQNTNTELKKVDEHKANETSDEEDDLPF